MGLLNQIIITDAAAFTDTDGFGETVTYTPVTGSPRSISAFVERDPPDRISPDGDVYRPKMEITVANSATLGILATEIDNGGDTVTVAYPLGATAAAHAILGTPIVQDAGMIRLELA